MRLRSTAPGTRKRRQEKVKSWLVYGLAALCFGAGAYLLVLILSPPILMSPATADWNTLVSDSPDISENRLYIPKLKLNITYKEGWAEVLARNAWHRYPERGNPEKGGNFILAAHRLELGFTPGETRQKSPFYYLNHLEPGDKLYVDFEGVRYEYTVTKRFSVKPDAVEIEEPTEDPVMTLYTCTLKGEKDGREVIRAARTRIGVNPTVKL